MVEKSLPDRHFWQSARFWLAGPVTFIAAICVMAGGAVWVPKGQAEVDNIVLPLVLFPVIWVVLFFYGCLTTQVKRAYKIIGGVVIVQMVLIALHLL